MKVIALDNKKRVKEIVDIHMKSFKGFFLTFLGKGFLDKLYKGFIGHEGSELLAAVNDEGDIIGFLAYSNDLSGFYKYLIKIYLVPFAWYAILGVFKNPKILFRILRAFSYSNGAKRTEEYIELSSIGVLPEKEGIGIGTNLINALKEKVDSSQYKYIKLETDVEDNEEVNCFYQKNGFVLNHEYETHEGRKMNEYRFYLVNH